MTRVDILGSGPAPKEQRGDTLLQNVIYQSSVSPLRGLNKIYSHPTPGFRYAPPWAMLCYPSRASYHSLFIWCSLILCSGSHRNISINIQPIEYPCRRAPRRRMKHFSSVNIQRHSSLSLASQQGCPHGEQWS